MNPLWLTIKEDDWLDLNAFLLQPDGMERQCFLELGLSRRKQCTELIAHRINPVPDEEYSIQTRVRVRPNQKAVFKAYQSFVNAGVAVQGHVHSHPFSRSAVFSGQDVADRQSAVRGLADLVYLQELSPETCFFQWVIGRDPRGSQGFLLKLNGEPVGELERVRVVGQSGVRSYSRADASGMIALPEERFDRNIRWLGEKGQTILINTHVAICGVGGVGALLATNLKGLGFKEITLIDPDRIELSNLNRFDGAGIDDVGAFKVDVVKREIERVAPETRVNALPVGVENLAAQELIREADVILAALDGMSPRLELQVLAARFLKPLFDLGSGIHVSKDGSISKMGSHIIVYLPGGPCLACQGMDIFRPTGGLAGELRRRTGYVAGTDFTPTSVVTINSVVAGWAVDLLIKYLTGLIKIPRYTTINQWKGTVETLNFKGKPHCSLCGVEGIEGKGENLPVLEILDDGEADLQIISVAREYLPEECSEQPLAIRQSEGPDETGKPL